RDESIERSMARMQDLVRAVREIRNRYSVEPKHGFDPRVRSSEAVAAELTPLADFVKSLAGVATLQIGTAVSKPAQAGHYIHADFGGYVSLEGLIDVPAEIGRLQKQLAEKRKHVTGMEAKLQNPSFVDKAPAEIVQQQRDQVAEAKSQI